VTDAEGVLRAHVRAALRNAGLSQASAASDLGISQKHLSQMLTGRATLTLPWAEELLALCGVRLVLDTAPTIPGAPDA
jgi:transcriptional regulator with XRE-family HTH domain